MLGGGIQKRGEDRHFAVARGLIKRACKPKGDINPFRHGCAVPPPKVIPKELLFASRGGFSMGGFLCPLFLYVVAATVNLCYPEEQSDEGTQKRKLTGVIVSFIYLFQLCDIY